MGPDRWHRVTGAFHAALALDEASRVRFLHDACAGDAPLRAEVEALLAAHDQAGRFGDVPLAPSQDTLGSEDEEACSAQAPQSNRRRSHSFLWAVWLAAAITAAAFVYAAASLLVRGGASVGWTEQRRHGQWYVDLVEPDGPASDQLKAGDRIVSFNGEGPADGPGTRFLRAPLSAGDRYSITVDRNSLRRDLYLVVADDFRALARKLTYLLISLVWCAVGLFIGLARPDQAAARLAFAAAVATGLAYLSAAVIQAGPLWGPLHVVLGYQFFCRFPTGRKPSGIWKWATGLLYAVALPGALLGLWLTATLLASGAATGTRLSRDHQILFPVFRGSLGWVTYCGAFFGMSAVTWHNYHLLTDEDARRRVRWVVASSVAALLPQFWSAAVAAFAFWFGPTGAPALGFPVDVFSVAIPASVAYAVVRHRVFDITVVLRRGVQYLLARRALQALTAIPLVVLAYTIAANRHRTIAHLASETRAYLYWGAAAALTLRFRRPVRVWLDRRFFREEYDHEQMLLGVVDDLGRADSISHLSELVSAKVQVALHPSSVYFWYRDASEFAAVSSSNPRLTPPDFPAGGRWLSWLEGQGGVAEFPLPPDAGLSRRESHWLSTRGVSLLIPIGESSERLAGVLLLGPKKSEEPYTGSDRRLLHAIAKQAAVVRENLRLRAQVSEEQRIRHDVLERLDPQHVNLLKECPLCGACFDGPAERCDRDGQALTLSLPVFRVIDGKYRLDRLIGKGGMGAVYEANDLRLQRDVAVKILLGRAFGEQKALRRFRAEARAAARLNHPRIVSVYEYGPLEGEGAYIVMERVRGVTLRDEMGRASAIKPADVAAWFDQILDGLAAAHAHGVVHRDLKPENIIGGRDDEHRLAVKILDFGLAKMSGGDAPATGTLTAEGVVMGTVGYMSPEQVLGTPADHRTDIFAVGVMLAEALTGQPPFHGDTRADLSRAVVHDAYHLPCFSQAAYAIDELLQRCLAKDPGDRFASAAALREALIPLLLTCPPFSFGAVA